MTRDQKVVAVGSLSGVATMAAATFALSQLWPTPEGLVDLARRLAYALKLDAFAALPLLLGIIAVANARFGSEAIDPLLNKESQRMRVDGRFVDNTVQQLVLFVIATLALAATLPPARMTLIPAAVIVFVAARLAFWAGYRIRPIYRAFGMGATIYLNLGLIGYALWRSLFD